MKKALTFYGLTLFEVGLNAFNTRTGHSLETNPLSRISYRAA